MKWHILASVFALFVIAVVKAQDSRPVIGVLTQNYKRRKSRQYLKANVVDWLTRNGAHVVPIMGYDSKKKLSSQFRNLDGWLLPGSNGPGPGYKRTHKLIMKWTLKAKKKGRTVMGAGICWGFQEMADYVARKTVSRGSYRASYFNLPVEYLDGKNKSDFRITKGLTDEMDSWLQDIPLTYNIHVHGVSPKTMKKNKHLRRFFDVVYTSTAPKSGKKFVALMEAKNLPLYGFQWHPEDAEKLGNITQSDLNKQVMGNDYFAKFLVEEARKNMHSRLRRRAVVPTRVEDMKTVRKHDGKYKFSW